MTPHCGQCDYILTGVEQNRCPECGGMFIDVGVNLRSEVRCWYKRKMLLFVFGCLFLIAASISISGFMAMRARREAAIAKQRAIQAAQYQQIFQMINPKGETPKSTAEMLLEMNEHNWPRRDRNRRSRGNNEHIEGNSGIDD